MPRCAGPLLLLVFALGCARTQLAPLPETLPPPDPFPLIAADFYERLANRRFDSIATFQDPSLREFFSSEESFADYYADLSQDLYDFWFEASRPSRVEIEAIATLDENKAIVRVHFYGRNGRPLRWWSVELVRDDAWEQVASGRWRIQPGKL